ncbi:hypothetical protein LCGC14_1331210, partial [marine sediment metagenome]
IPEGLADKWENEWRSLEYWGKRVPFAGELLQYAELVNIGLLAYKLQDNTITSKELWKLKEFSDRARRKTSFWFKVSDVVEQGLQFIPEMIASAGIGKAAQEGTQKALAAGLRRVVGKEIRDKIIDKMAVRGMIKVGGKIAEMGVRTIVSRPTAMLAGYARERLPEYEIIERDGTLSGIFKKEGRDKWSAGIRAVVNEFIEVGSELGAFGLYDIPLGTAGKKLREQMVKYGLIRAMKKINPNIPPGKLARAMEKGAWHGVLGEMGEERVGEIARTLILGDEYNLPTLEQLMVELVGFSVLGGPAQIESALQAKKAKRAQVELDQRSTNEVARRVLDNVISAHQRRIQQNAAMLDAVVERTGEQIFEPGREFQEVDATGLIRDWVPQDEADIIEEDAREMNERLRADARQSKDAMLTELIPDAPSSGKTDTEIITSLERSGLDPIDIANMTSGERRVRYDAFETGEEIEPIALKAFASQEPSKTITPPTPTEGVQKPKVVQPAPARAEEPAPAKEVKIAPRELTDGEKFSAFVSDLKSDELNVLKPADIHEFAPDQTGSLEKSKKGIRKRISDGLKEKQLREPTAAPSLEIAEGKFSLSAVYNALGVEHEAIIKSPVRDPARAERLTTSEVSSHIEKVKSFLVGVNEVIQHVSDKKKREIAEKQLKGAREPYADARKAHRESKFKEAIGLADQAITWAHKALGAVQIQLAKDMTAKQERATKAIEARKVAAAPAVAAIQKAEAEVAEAPSPAPSVPSPTTGKRRAKKKVTAPIPRKQTPADRKIERETKRAEEHEETYPNTTQLGVIERMYEAGFAPETGEIFADGTVEIWSSGKIKYLSPAGVLTEAASAEVTAQMEGREVKPPKEEKKEVKEDRTPDLDDSGNIKSDNFEAGAEPETASAAAQGQIKVGDTVKLRDGRSGKIARIDPPSRAGDLPWYIVLTDTGRELLHTNDIAFDNVPEAHLRRSALNSVSNLKHQYESITAIIEARGSTMSADILSRFKLKQEQLLNQITTHPNYRPTLLRHGKSVAKKKRLSMAEVTGHPAIKELSDSFVVPVIFLAGPENMPETTIDDLALREQVLRASTPGSPVKGAMRRDRQVVYVFTTSHTTIEDVVETILHEAIGHVGILNLVASGNLPEKEFFSIVLGHRKLAAQARRNEEFGMSAGMAAEEAFADFAQRDEIPQSVWDRMVALIMRALRTIMPSLKTSDAELKRLVSRAIKAASRPDITPTVQQANLERWAAGSIVRDSDGKLIVQHHGSLRDFNEFEFGDIGFHFGTSGQAKYRARQMSYIARGLEIEGVLPPTFIKPFYLNIKNPLRTSDLFDRMEPSKALFHLYDELQAITTPQYDQVLGILQDLSDASAEYEFDVGEEMPLEQQLGYFKEAFRQMQNALKENGYDGIVYENRIEGEGNSYIIFDSNQAKSPTENIGLYQTEMKNTLFRLQAHHGTGQKLTKGAFDTGFVGEGEGVQAFGWGLYFTSKEAIAKEYAASGYRARQPRDTILFDGIDTVPIASFEAAYVVEVIRIQARKSGVSESDVKDEIIKRIQTLLSYR